MSQPKPFTTRTLLDFVFKGLEWANAGEIEAAVEKAGVLMDELLPTNKKEPIHRLCQRIVNACEADPELAQYFKTLAAAAKQVVDVADGKHQVRIDGNDRSGWSFRCSCGARRAGARWVRKEDAEAEADRHTKL